MKIFALGLGLLPAVFPIAARAAEKLATKDEIKALVLEDAKNAAKSPAAPATKIGPAKTTAAAAAAAGESAAPVVPSSPPNPVSGKSPPVEAAATLPQVEVNKSKITVLDHELHEQDRKMAFEAKNAKATELDSALNSPAVNPTILGGYSTKVRTGLAQERLELMEFEKELTELIARAKTKEEKAALKKQLDDLRTMRRTLESSGEAKPRNGR